MSESTPQPATEAKCASPYHRPTSKEIRELLDARRAAAAQSTTEVNKGESDAMSKAQPVLPQSVLSMSETAGNVSTIEAMSTVRQVSESAAAQPSGEETARQKFEKWWRAFQAGFAAGQQSTSRPELKQEIIDILMDINIGKLSLYDLDAITAKAEAICELLDRQSASQPRTDAPAVSTPRESKEADSGK